MGSECTCIVLNVDNWNSGLNSSKLRRSGNIWVYVRLKSGLGIVFCPGRLKFGIQLVQAGIDSGISRSPSMIYPGIAVGFCPEADISKVLAIVLQQISANVNMMKK